MYSINFDFNDEYIVCNSSIYRVLQVDKAYIYFKLMIMEKIIVLKHKYLIH